MQVTKALFQIGVRDRLGRVARLAFLDAREGFPVKFTLAPIVDRLLDELGRAFLAGAGGVFEHAHRNRVQAHVGGAVRLDIKMRAACSAAYVPDSRETNQKYDTPCVFIRSRPLKSCPCASSSLVF